MLIAESICRRSCFPMATHHTLTFILVSLLLFGGSLQNTANNQVDDTSPLGDIASALLKEQNVQNLGSMVSGFMASGGAQQLGDLLSNPQAGQLLQGLGSMMGGQGGPDPSLMGAALNLFSGAGAQNSGFDPSVILSMLGGLASEEGSEERSEKSLMDYMPMFLQLASAFVGPEADQRARAHKDHEWLLPPIVERFHVGLDHFMHSEMGQKMVNNLGAEKFVRIFNDENGQFSFRKMVDMFENHSFRKHWIRMVTDRIVSMLSYINDPHMQKKYLTTFQHFINSLLRTQGFPKMALFDQNRPIETITSMVNHFAKTQLNTQFSSKQYVKPAVEYLQEVMRLAQKKSVLGSGAESRQLSDKLADTINMEMIEPLARVNRAYRFARKETKCDKYVMCVVTREEPEDQLSLPGLKPFLGKGGSLVMSWFLSSHTGTPFWTLYSAVIDDTNCKAHFVEECDGFHVEETKVTTEYVHNEL